MSYVLFLFLMILLMTHLTLMTITCTPISQWFIVFCQDFACLEFLVEWFIFQDSNFKYHDYILLHTDLSPE